MPLVSTKSWNVRGAEQAARVERDEAAAAAAAREHARREQQAVAEQRLLALRANVAARDGLGAAALAAQVQAARPAAVSAGEPAQAAGAISGAERRKRPREGEGREPVVLHRGEPRLIEMTGPVPWYAGGAPRMACSGSGRSAEQDDPLLAVQAYLRATEQALQRASNALRAEPPSRSRTEGGALSRGSESDQASKKANKSHKSKRRKHRQHDDRG
jgi:hypothetical protein